MRTAEHYTNPPIVEAVLDIRCTVGDGIGPDELEKIQASQTDRYPHKQRLEEVKAEFRAQFDVKPDEPFAGTATRTPSGFASASSDRLQVFQATINGFVFARLKPYPGWDIFCEEAKRLWNEFRETAKPKSIDRIAVRTINRFDFPSQTVDLSEYFKTLPTIGEGVGSTIERFFMQVALPQPDIQGVAIITETIVAPSTSTGTAIVLDIDLWRTANLPQSDGELWTLLDEMREKKNAIFEACITQRMREEIAR